MKKFFSLIAAVLFAGAMMADVVTINATDVEGIESGATGTFDKTIEGVQIVWEGAYYNNDNNQDIRVYANKTLALTAEKNISKVEIVGFAKKGLAVTATSGTVTLADASAGDITKSDWADPLLVVTNINAKSVTFSCTKQMRAFAIRLTLDGEGGGGDDPQEITLDVEFADAMYIPSYEAWQFNLYKDYDYETQEVEYPDFYVAVPMKSETAIAGTYAAEDIMFIELDLAEGVTVEGVESSDLVVTYLGEGLYHFEMTFVGDDGNTYIVDATLKPVAYDYPDYNEITLTDELEPSNVENVVVKSATIKKIENGQLIIEKEGVRYNANGAVVR